MATMLFDRPIYVKRKHYIEEITCLDDAFDFLEDWPSDRRDLVYEMAGKACREAYAGTFPLAAAQETFRRFAKKTDILCKIEDVPSFARHASDRNLSGT
ncbi:DUF982 domain-containing protein [Sinorhizobium numidicum]|uniref:DUF982 domain-containing protein n=1 Tax=Sinorhizobium numidicum TaxID=680248 RepID=A0ABY8CW35_9HYPH|nr:DUF982 domain-containing protein [Sinorhizobium numidicum]WEX75553.1 DUF982 domain-containing protein [Sinorhizobium numidicum]WEX81550.1 DUF982 domain-containing protein [Sinorhizobium numidicum]